MPQETCHHTVRKGTAEGEYVFGHITADNELDAVMLRNCRSFKHYISLCATGGPTRKEGTMCRSPGSFIVKAGDNIGAEQPTPSGGAAGALNTASNVIGDNPLGNAIGAAADALTPTPPSSGLPGVYLEAVNGDVIIKATSGKIRLEAEDVVINASGGTGETGNLNISANNNITIDAKQSVEVGAEVLVNIKCQKLVEIRGMSALNLFGSNIDFADGGSSVFGSKGAWNYWEEQMRGLAAMARSSTTPTHSGH